MDVKRAQIDTLLLKSLLGQELVNTQFFLFSSRSKRAGKVTRPRALCTNNTIVVQSSEWFSKLLGTNNDFSDSAIFEFDEFHGLDDGISLSKYGYEEDSDLDDEDEDKGVGSTPMNGVVSGSFGPSSSSSSLASIPKPTESYESADEEKGGGIARSTINTPPKTVTLTDTTANADVPLRHIPARFMFVKDTAFQTWKTLLFYLYTGRVSFSNLRSCGTTTHMALYDTCEPPKCSPKSMYRLACKVGLQKLQEEARAAIDARLSKDNIVHELSFTLPSRFPVVLETELDSLFNNINSAPVVVELPLLLKRIAKDELPHGAEILTGLYKRVLKKHYPEQNRAQEEGRAMPSPPAPSTFGTASASASGTTSGKNVMRKGK